MTMRAPPLKRQRSPVLAIVADDLTGAADCAAACATRGLEAIVVLASEVLARDADVVAIDADTRALLPQAAADKIADISARLADKADLVFFKKLDSTLRGHFAVELAAMLSARRKSFPDSVALFAPAFPALGRTTVDGFHLLWGQPLEQTQPWREQHRSGRAFVPQMLSDADLRTQLLPLRCVRETEAALSETLRRLAQECDVIACDAETEEDLAALARASLSLGRQTVWAGSAGLVGPLVHAAAFDGSQPRTTIAPTPGARVFVVGSRSTVSRRQAARFSALEDVEVIDVDPTASAAALDKLDFKQRFSRALGSGKVVLIWQAGEDLPVATADVRQCGDLAAQIASYKDQIGAVFATGGETARSLLEAFGVGALRLIDEIEPGVALSMALGPADLAVITKAGAFGNDATMAVSLAALSDAAMASRNSAHPRRVG